MSPHAPHPPTDEFRFLASDAALVGRSGDLPDVRRVSVPLPDGRQLSALRFGGLPTLPRQDQSAEPPIEFAMLHGMGLNAHSFDPTALALGRSMLSVDLAGHGRSDWRGDADYRPDLLAEDVLVALDALASDPFVLVGHSLGALTAILVAAQRPDLVRALVLLDLTPGVVPSSDAASVTEFIAGQRTFDSIDEIVDRAMDFGIGHDRAALTRGVALNTRLRPDGKIEWTHHFAHLLPDSKAAAALADDTATTSAPIGTDADKTRPFAALWAPLAALSVPITLVRGTTGMVSESLLVEWRERLPNTVVETLNTGHNVHEQDPTGLARVLAKAGHATTAEAATEVTTE